VSGRLRRLAAVLLVGALLAACGPDEPTASASPSAVPKPTPTTTTYRLGTAVWYAGLVMTFGTATAVLDEHGGTVAVETTIENRGSDDQTLGASIRIVAGGKAFEPTRDSVLPTLAAGATAYTTLHYDVVGLGTVDDAVLQVGAPGEHHGVVPFVAGSVAPVTLQPVAVAASGTGNAASLRLTVRSAELRWDLPDWAAELPSGIAALTVSYDVTYRGTFSGGFAFTGANVALRLPDGSIVRARDDGRSQSLALLLPGRIVRGLATRFEIPAGVPGSYALLVENGSARATIPLAIPG
jgi:hypothetical protein